MSPCFTAFLLRHSRMFSLHTITGAVSVLAHYLIMWILGRAGVAPIAASMSGFVAGAVIKFALSFQHVFPTRQEWHYSAAKFVMAIGIQAGLNWTLVRAGLVAGLNLWTAQVLTTGLLVAINYVMYRYWVFGGGASN